MVDLRKKVDFGTVLRNNAVTIMFVVLCIVCLYFSGLTVPYVMYELFGRLSRNAFIVLALILPIVAGMGTSTLATGMPRVRTPWNRKVPISTWLILQREVEAPPIRMADAATKPI